MRDQEFLELVKVGKTSEVKEKFDANPTLVNSKGQWGRTALHWAVENGWVDIVQLLITRGAKVTIGDEYGETPLFIAAIDHFELVPLLLGAGAGINERDLRGATPLHSVVFLGEIIKAQSLLDLGADINATTTEGLTPLHLAVGNVKMLSLLLEHGAKVDSPTAEGCTPLHLAAGALIERHMLPCYLESIETLVHYGADLTARTSENETPLDCAQKPFGHPEITDLLIQLESKTKKV